MRNKEYKNFKKIFLIPEKSFSYLSIETENFIIKQILEIDTNSKNFTFNEKEFNNIKEKFENFRISQFDKSQSYSLEENGSNKNIYFQNKREINKKIFQELYEKKYIIKDTDVYYIFSNKMVDYFFIKNKLLKNEKTNKIITYVSLIFIPVISLIISIIAIWLHYA